MSETMAPEDVRELMNRCFDGMVDAVKRYDGHVDKFIGDCIMVVFGAPKSHEDDPERAVRCALDMQAWLTEVNKTVARPLGVRIGINAGEVVAGGVGGKDTKDYTVMGDVVNTANRIESAASIGRIWVSRSVKQLTKRAISYRELRPIQVKGKREALAVYEVEGLVGEVANRAEPLIGRVKEMAAMTRIIDRALGRSAGGVILLGEAGMGKSRLLREAGFHARSRGLTIAAGVAGRFIEAQHLELVRSIILSVCTGAGPVEPQLRSLSRFGVSELSIQRAQQLFGSTARSAETENDDLRRLDCAAVIDILLTLATKKGLCIIADDLHRADSASLEILERLTSRASGCLLAFLGSARPGSTEKLLPTVAKLELLPMSAREVLEIVSAQLNGASVPDSVGETILERAEGSPLLARELVRTLIDAGSIQLSGGTWQVLPTLRGTKIPETIQLIVGARFDALSAPARQLLRVGAVIGRIFNLELLGNAADDDFPIASALQECVNRGFLNPMEDGADSYQFAQAAFYEVVLRNLTKADLRHTHLRIAEALERGVSSGSDDVLQAMARHFLDAEQNRKAIKYLSLSGDRLVERGACSEAAAQYRNALQLSIKEVGRAALSETAANHLLELASKAAHAQTMIHPSATLALIDPVLEMVPANRAAVARAELLRQKAAAFTKLSRIDEALGTLQTATLSLSGQDDPQLSANLQADISAACEAKGDLPSATRHLTEGLKLVSKGHATDLLWRYLNQLGRLHLRTGQVDRAVEFFENARLQAQRARNTFAESKTITNLAGAIAMRGNIAGAASLLEDALALASKAGDQTGVARIQYNLGRLLLSSGQVQAGTAQLTAALNLSNELGWREGAAAALQALAVAKAKPRAPAQA